MERETLNAEEIATLFKSVKKLPKRTQWLSKKTRPVSKIAPIAIPKKRAPKLDMQPAPKPAAKRAAKPTVKPTVKPKAK
jgi:cell division protease FtsH